MKNIFIILGALATLGSVIAIYDILATDKEVDAKIKENKKYSDLNYYDRMVEFAELRKDIYCFVKPEQKLCDFWTKQLEKQEEKRKDSLRK